MKQYTSRELSERLVKLGCKSQSGFYYLQGRTKPVSRWLDEEFLHPIVPAFEFEDFCGTHDQAEENRAVLRDWFSVHECLDSLGSNNWLKYLEEVLADI